MKIAIISSYAWIKVANNYGALLQYYALQKYLKKMGHEIFWIRYLSSPNKQQRFYRKYLFKIKQLFHGLKAGSIQKSRKQCTQSFEHFIEQYLKLSPLEYNSWEKICKNPPEADVYITGSDQVWGGVCKANFLEFAPSNKLLLSYAASFGKIKLSSEVLPVVSKMLKKFNSISVREIEGIDICKEAGRNDAVHVVDPTFLLEKKDYDALISLDNTTFDISKPYIFSYFLNIRGDKSQIYWDTICEYSNKKSLQLKVNPIQGAEYFFPKEYIVMPSPVEWLNYYTNASYIITNSFHGTVFSIIMKKPFLVILQSGRNKEQNCRFFSLLERLGLKERIYYHKVKSFAEQIEKGINWKSVNNKIFEFREFSKEFLLKALKS